MLFRSQKLNDLQQQKLNDLQQLKKSFPELTITEFLLVIDEIENIKTTTFFKNNS